MYAAAAVQGHDICPFCKEIFPEGAHASCPHCEVHLIPASKATPLVEAAMEDDELEDGEPVLPWTHWGHGRGPMLVACLLGLGVFLLPWVHVFTPDRAVYTGPVMGERTRVAWAAAVAWFTLIPTILSRRTVSKLRSGRVAAALLAFIPGLVAFLFLMNPPDSLQVHGVTMKIRFEWGIGLYLTLLLGALSTPFAALRLGR